MSKKLIAVAAASALALSALVAAPAYAAPSIAVTGNTGGTTGTAASPFTVLVPSANTVTDTGTPNALKFVVSGLATEDVVRVTSTGSVKILDTATALPTASAFINVTTLGKTDITKNRTSDAAYTFFVHTTSTVTGTVNVSVTRTGLTSSNTYSVKGLAGSPHKATVTGGVPATLAATKTSDVTFTVADVFGNLLEGATSPNIVGKGGTDNMGLVEWDATAKVYKSKMTSPSNGAFIAKLDMSPSAEIAGFADTELEIVAVVNSVGNASLTTQVATLTAQVASLQAIVDRKVSKKRFNTLARKWNRAFPSQAVKLKK
jgi:hypothetical protein